MPHVAFDPADVPAQIHIDDAAAVTGTPIARWRSSWIRAGIIRPCSRPGGLAFDLPSVVRGALYAALQRALGSTSPVATDLIRSLSDADVLGILQAAQPVIAAEVSVSGETVGYTVKLDPEMFESVRSKLMRLSK